MAYYGNHPLEGDQPTESRNQLESWMIKLLIKLVKTNDSKIKIDRTLSNSVINNNYDYWEVSDEICENSYKLKSLYNTFKYKVLDEFRFKNEYNDPYYQRYYIIPFIFIDLNIRVNSSYISKLVKYLGDGGSEERECGKWDHKSKDHPLYYVYLVKKYSKQLFDENNADSNEKFIKNNSELKVLLESFNIEGDRSIMKNNILNENQLEIQKNCMFLNEGLFPSNKDKIIELDIKNVKKDEKNILNIKMKNLDKLNIEYDYKDNDIFFTIDKENGRRINRKSKAYIETLNLLKRLYGSPLINIEFEYLNHTDYKFCVNYNNAYYWVIFSYDDDTEDIQVKISLLWNNSSEFDKSDVNKLIRPEFCKTILGLNFCKNVFIVRTYSFKIKNILKLLSNLGFNKENYRVRSYKKNGEIKVFIKDTKSSNKNESLDILSEAIDLKKILKLSGEKFTKAMNHIAKFAKNAVTRDKFRRAKLTSSIAEIKELLEPDCVQAFILAGATSCNKFLLPFLAEYFTNGSVTAKEKEAKVKQLKNDFKEASRIADEEFDASLKKINEQGVKYFKENINEVIKPYKL